MDEDEVGVSLERAPAQLSAGEPDERSGRWNHSNPGVAAHPLTWYLLYLWVYLTDAHLEDGLINIQVANPLESVGFSFFYACYSLLFVGWITALIGGVLGGGFACAYRLWARVPGDASERMGK